jgi:N-acetylneuraminate synthase
MVDIAADAQADAIKFQSFKSTNIVTDASAKAPYQLRNTQVTESQLAMLQSLELSEEEHFVLSKRCNQKGIEFLSTPFDNDSVDLLSKRISVRRLKIPSGEVTNGPLLLKVAETQLPIILSTGMSTIPEIEEALSILAYGLSTNRRSQPSRTGFRQAFASNQGQQTLQKHVTLLHCTTEYPAPVEEANLRAINSLKERFCLPVGLSDHTLGTTVAIAAVARGAVVIEKHFTTSRTLPGPDHLSSLEPDELVLLINQIRIVENALGDGVKQPTPSELRNISIARRSIVAAQNIMEGETLTNTNLAIKRPGSGRSPMDFWDLVGKTATRSYRRDDQIE